MPSSPGSRTFPGEAMGGSETALHSPRSRQQPTTELYRAAILELDPELLQARVKAAEDAIRSRGAVIGDIPGGERIAMRGASSSLNILKRQINLARQPDSFNFRPASIPLKTGIEIAVTIMSGCRRTAASMRALASHTVPTIS